MQPSITAVELQQALAGPRAPLVVDVRREPAYRAAHETIAGALRREADTVSQWGATLPARRPIVVYCVHGHEVSQGAARMLMERGIEARYLEGGIEEGWKAGGGALDTKPADAPSRWITRERPKIDRIACPWLISRFVDAQAEFLYVPGSQLHDVACIRQATAYDTDGAPFTHVGERCTFDALLAHFRLADPALERLALIVRGADTGEVKLAPQAAGLLAISLGLSLVFADDHEMLARGLVIYDALYAWCRKGLESAALWSQPA